MTIDIKRTFRDIQDRHDYTVEELYDRILIDTRDYVRLAKNYDQWIICDNTRLGFHVMLGDPFLSINEAEKQLIILNLKGVTGLKIIKIKSSDKMT